MKIDRFNLATSQTLDRISIAGGRKAGIGIIRTKSSKRAVLICKAYRNQYGLRQADLQEKLKMKSEGLYDCYLGTVAKPQGIHVDWWRHHIRYRPVYLGPDGVSLNLGGYPMGSKAVLCRMPNFVSEKFLSEHEHLIRKECPSLYDQTTR